MAVRQVAGNKHQNLVRIDSIPYSEYSILNTRSQVLVKDNLRVW